MLNSKILATFFPVKSAAKNQDKPFRLTTFDLVRRAVDFEKRKFETIYENHHRPVYRLCLRMTQNAGVALDLTQRVFVKLFEVLKNRRENSELNTQILQLAINELLLYLISDDNRFNQTDDSEFKKILENSCAEQTAKSAVNRRAIEKAIAELPIDFRLIFLLHDFERLTHEEIAGILKIDVETSKLNLYEARNILRRRLSE